MTLVHSQTVESALRTEPDQAAHWHDYGQMLQRQGALLRALNAYRVAAALAPNHQAYALSLCQLLLEIGEVEQAIQHLAALPGHLLQGDLGRALGRFQLRLRCYQPATDTVGLMETIERAERLSAGSAVPMTAAPRDPGRPLRVAYLSGRWADERWVRQVLPNLMYRQRGRYEVFVYDSGGNAGSGSAAEEALERVRRFTDRWVSVAGWKPAALQAQCLADQLDILVDVDGYSAHGSGLSDLGQIGPWRVVSWLGMPWAGVTDAVIADQHLLPDAVPRSVSKLPFGHVSWLPPEEIPAPIAVSPSRTAQQVTLASLNPPAAISVPVVAAWAEILRQIPTAQLRLFDAAFVDDGVVKAIQQRFAREGIEANRVRCACLPSDGLARLRLYQEVDVALDTFPVSGPMSACEALWMGIPVVTLRGQAAWQNTTASVLAAAGVAEWITDQVNDYVTKVIALVANTDARDAYRRDLREMVELSPLCAGRLFARHFEQSLVHIWRAGGNPKPDGDE